jgi:hypothetical protein
MSVAFATDQRNVADWPLSTELGSAVKVSIRGSAGFAGGGGSTLVAVTGAGGGGGGAAATFFLQATADKSSAAANTVALSVSLLIRILLTWPPQAVWRPEHRLLTRAALSRDHQGAVVKLDAGHH